MTLIIKMLTDERMFADLPTLRKMAQGRPCAKCGVAVAGVTEVHRELGGTKARSFSHPECVGVGQ